MNHIPKFLIYNNKKHNKMSNRAPKLERRLAMKKNIDYDPPPQLSDTATCQSLRTRSLDLSTSTSFRIQGIDDNEVDLICQTIGLSGPDDLSIPAAAWEAWEACKARSVSDLLPRLREEDEEREREREGQNREHVFDLSTRFNDSVRVSDQVIINKDQCPIVENTTSDDIFSDRCALIDFSDQCSTSRGREGVKSARTNLMAPSPSVLPKVVNNTSPILDIHGNRNATVDSMEHCSSSRNGVKGVNMYLMAPRASFLPTIVDNTSSNLDINSGVINSIRCADVESTDSCSTSRGGTKGETSSFSHSIIDNTRSNCDISSSDNNGGANVDKHAIFGSTGGIKGLRPPLLAPPPSISTRVIDNTSSTWDIMRSFAPDSEKTPSFARERSFYSDDEEEREVRPRGSAAFLSESCSFTTTSNDDDSSSTTTEPMSNISPNGRFKRVITYWEKGELLGRGSFGTVYEGIADGGYFIAVKEVSLLDQGDMGRQSIYQLEQEIALLSQFEHENIVQYYGTDKDEAHLYIFLELVTKGSLLSLYQKYHLRDSQVSSYTRQILLGLKYLHERNVVHRDIKCANILVGADGSVKLADFGLAKATKLNDVKSCKGTAFWMAPEVVRGRQQGYGLPADIWSLGCTVLEMLTHRIPYSPLDGMQALFRIGRGEPPPIPDSLSRDARDFISRCLKVDPNDRPTATQLLEHSFVRRPLSTSSGSSSPYHSIGRGLNLS